MNVLAYWQEILDSGMGAEGCPFEKARAQVADGVIDFKVRLLLPDEDTPFERLADDVADLLERYGMAPERDRGIRHGPELLPLHDDVDVLVVFVLSGELQALCSELAQLPPHGRTRLLPCVPEGQGNDFLSQILRQKHGVGSVPLPCARILAEERSSFGIDVVRSCANALTTKLSAQRKRLRYESTVVMLIHGIRTRGEWLSGVKTTLAEEGLPTYPTNYGKLGIVPFLLPFHFTKYLIVRNVRTDVAAARARFPDGKLAVVAHSFGTYVVGRMVKRGIRFDRVILCGSILPRHFRFPTPTGALNTVINDVGSKDVWPVWASKLSWLYGSSGSFGFNHGVYADDRYHAQRGHSDFLNADFARDYWLPYICEDRIVPGLPRAEPARSLKFVDALPIRGILLALVAFAGYRWLRA